MEYMISPVEDTIEEALATKELIVKMLDCLALLDDRDRYHIIELFYHGKSERILSLEIGVPPMTIHDRKCKILKKLRKLISQ